MGDDQTYSAHLQVKDASGPYHDFRQHLQSFTKEQDIPLSSTFIHLRSDASAVINKAGAEVKHALELQSSHSYERTHIDSVVAIERMVDAYLKSAHW